MGLLVFSKGANYYAVDMEMNCDDTERGWFEFRAFERRLGAEADVLVQDCNGHFGGVPPYHSRNHMARCGFVNVFHFGSPECEINAVKLKNAAH